MWGTRCTVQEYCFHPKINTKETLFFFDTLRLKSRRHTATAIRPQHSWFLVCRSQNSTFCNSTSRPINPIFNNEKLISFNILYCYLFSFRFRSIITFCVHLFLFIGISHWHESFPLAVSCGLSKFSVGKCLQCCRVGLYLAATRNGDGQDR